MKSTARLRRILPIFLACSAITASGETLFTSGFDANTGATLLAANTDNAAVTSSTLTITDWVKNASVTSISGLTAISTDNGVFTAGGFAQLQNGTATYANANNVYLSRNSQTVGTAPRNRGFSLTFTLDSAWVLTTLTVLSGHTTNSGNQDQSFASDLVFNLSGGTLGSPVTATSNQNYATAPAYHSVPFVLTGTTLGAGTYTLEVYQTAATGGSYAIFDGVTLAAATPIIDTDGDGLEDSYEQTIIGFDLGDGVTTLAHVMGTGAAPVSTDFDFDGSDDAEELAVGTIATNPDTDGDGFRDGAETLTGTFVSYNYATKTGDTGTNPLDSDTDNDGLLDGVESGTAVFVSSTNTGSNPNQVNSDASAADALPDGWEVANGLNPNKDAPPHGDFDDPDNDTLTNLEEYTNYSTRADLADTDGDGIRDDVEIFNTLTNPRLSDSDGDGLGDKQEDLNTNGTVDSGETSPLNPDTDGDLYTDGAEVAAGSNPALVTSVPASSILSCNFNGNTGATVLAGDTDPTSGSSSLGVSWNQGAGVSAVSSLTAISTGDSGALGGFAQLQGGTATYANGDNVYLSRNLNLDTDRSTSRRGFSLDFTLTSPAFLGRLMVLSGHTTNTGNQDQSYSSSLVVRLSGGSLAAAVTSSQAIDYATGNAYRPAVFDLTGASLGVGSYTLEIYQTNLTTGGAFAMFNGILLDAGAQVPEELRVIRSAFNGPVFEVEVTGLAPSGSYVLKRSATLADGFPTQIGIPVTPGSNTHIFSDPSPVGAKAFYRVEEAP